MGAQSAKQEGGGKDVNAKAEEALNFTLSFFQEKAKEALAAEPPPDDSTPRLVLVMPSLEGHVPSTMTLDDRRRRFLQKALRTALEAEGFHIEKFQFSESGSLKDKEGWAVALGPKRIQRAAEREGLRKLRSFKAAIPGHGERTLERWDDCSGEAWACRQEIFQSEALVLQQARAYSALLPGSAKLSDEDDQEFSALGALGQSSSVLALAEAAGAVEQVAALHDNDVSSELLSKWPSMLKPWAALPLEDVVRYFGIQTAHYFLFLHEYTIWLMVPALLGLLLHCWHAFSGAEGSVTSTRGATIFMTLMTVWSTLFIEQWKRKRFELNYKSGFHEAVEHAFDPQAPAFFQVGDGALKEAMQPRSQAEKPADWAKRVVGRSRQERDILQLVTKEEKLTAGASALKKLAVVIFTAQTVIPMLVLLAVVACVVHFLLWVGDVVEKRFDNVVVQNLPVVLYLVVAYFLEQFYLKVGRKLTGWEGHALYAEYLQSLTSKAALFQLVNYLGWFLYVAFWMMDIPLLQGQLMMFMSVKQVIALTLEAVVPAIQHRRTKKSKGGSKASAAASAAAISSAEGLRQRKGATAGEAPKTTADSSALLKECEQQLALTKVDLGGEYLQLAVLFATTTSFAVAFPLGPLLAFIHTLVSRYTDAFKLLTLCQRAPPRYSDVVISDTWLGIFEAISSCAVAVSFACWALADDHNWTPLQIAVMEHAVLFFKFYAAWAIPDCPQAVRRKEVAFDVLERHDMVSPVE